MRRPKTNILHRRRPLKPLGEHFNGHQRTLCSWDRMLFPRRSGIDTVRA